MPRYIDADALEWRYIPLTIQPEEFVTKSDIEKAQIADVVERKVGKWEFIGGYGYQYRCSVCLTCAEHRTKFCPKCGSQMEE